jgi:hypothetical protein
MNRPPYHFDGGVGWRLHRYYGPRMGGINRYRRPHFYAGGFFPQIWVGNIQPIPPELLMYMPPVPPGYAVGYYDGYCIVYDPNSLYILSVIDLFRY